MMGGYECKVLEVKSPGELYVQEYTGILHYLQPLIICLNLA